MRVVVDTNVLLQGVFWNGHARRILERVISGRFVLVFSIDTLFEVIEVFQRAEITSKQVYSQEKLLALFHILKKARYVVPTESIRICRDPFDDVILEAATAGKVDAIVTYDKDLLVLDPFRGIRVLRPEGILG